jgi:hypothetical protein
MGKLVCRAALVGLIGFFAGFFAMPAQVNAGVPSPYVTAAPAYDTAFHPVCLSGSFYACRTEPYGTRFCGCWLGGDHPACPIGYRFACGPAPTGRPACGCF